MHHLQQCQYIFSCFGTFVQIYTVFPAGAFLPFSPFSLGSGHINKEAIQISQSSALVQLTRLPIASNVSEIAGSVGISLSRLLARPVILQRARVFFYFIKSLRNLESNIAFKHRLVQFLPITRVIWVDSVCKIIACYILHEPIFLFLYWLIMYILGLIEFSQPIEHIEHVTT